MELVYIYSGMSILALIGIVYLYFDSRNEKKMRKADGSSR